MSNLMRTRTLGERSLMLLALLALFTLDGRQAWSSDDLVSNEYQIKAAFLYNFTKFVEWPAPSFSGPGDPIVIGVYCSEPFAATLEKIVLGRKVNGRVIAVRRLTTASDARTVHLLFVCTAQDLLLSGIQAEVQSRPVVTVGESEADTRSGVAIRFLREDDKLRFGIDMVVAARAGVKISAQLQKLATTVIRVP